MTKLKPRQTTRPPKPSMPNAFRKLTPSAAAVQDAVAKIPQPAPLPKTEAETDAVLGRMAPPAKPTLRASLRADLRQLKQDVLWVWSGLLWLWRLFWEAATRVAAYLLAAMLLGMAGLVCILTFIELWTPAKAIADALAARMMQR